MVTFAWPLAVLVALVGWGYAGSWVTKLVAGVEPRSSGDILALGIALFLAIGGFAVGIGVFNSLVIYIGVAVGIGCALVELVRRLRVSHGLPGRLEIVNVLVVVVLVLAVLVVALWTTAHFIWNPCDDDAAYLYLAKRLALTGDLLDPMSNRRLTSLGGMSALQALFLVRLPDSSLPFADLFLGPVLVMFGLWRSNSRRWAVGGIASAFLLVLFPHNLGPSNTSPILIPIGLAIAAFSVAFDMRVVATAARGRLVCASILGLLLGSATILRPQFALIGLVAIVLVCWPPWDFGVLQRLGGLGIGLTIILAGWAAASWRAVGTPMFPIVSGNLDPTWPADGPAAGAVSLTELIGRLASSLLNPPWAAALVLSMGALVLALTRPQVAELYRRWGLRLEVVAALASVASVTLLMRIYWTAGPPSLFPRFWAPIAMAAVLMPIVLINRSGTERSRVAALASISIFLLVGLSLTANPRAGLHEVRLIAQDTVTGQVTNQLHTDRYASIRADYADAAELIPPGSKVLAAVDVPSLLIRSSFELNTLDIAGSTSPSPHLPYFRGTQAKLNWLRDQGYNYIIAVDPSASACLYNDRLVAEDVAGENGQVYKAWAPFFVDWFAFIRDVSDPSVASMTRAGTLIVVKL